MVGQGRGSTKSQNRWGQRPRPGSHNKKAPFYCEVPTPGPTRRWSPSSPPGSLDGSPHSLGYPPAHRVSFASAGIRTRHQELKVLREASLLPTELVAGDYLAWWFQFWAWARILCHGWDLTVGRASLLSLCLNSLHKADAWAYALGLRLRPGLALWACALGLCPYCFLPHQ